MDRMITTKPSRFYILEDFEYIHLFPYTLAVIMLLAEVYILNAFITISHNLR